MNYVELYFGTCAALRRNYVDCVTLIIVIKHYYISLYMYLPTSLPVGAIYN